MPQINCVVGNGDDQLRSAAESQRAMAKAHYAVAKNFS